MTGPSGATPASLRPDPLALTTVPGRRRWAAVVVAAAPAPVRRSPSPCAGGVSRPGRPRWRTRGGLIRCRRPRAARPGRQPGAGRRASARCRSSPRSGLGSCRRRTATASANTPSPRSPPSSESPDLRSTATSPNKGLTSAYLANRCFFGACYICRQLHPMRIGDSLRIRPFEDGIPPSRQCLFGVSSVTVAVGNYWSAATPVAQKAGWPANFLPLASDAALSRWMR